MDEKTFLWRAQRGHSERKGANERLSDSDICWLQWVVKNLIEMGMQLDTTKIDLCNLIYGDDFLADTPSADLIILSYINRWCFEESPLLEQGVTWEQAIKKCDAPIIGLISGACCVSSEDMPENYLGLPTKEETKRALGGGGIFLNQSFAIG